MEIKKAAEKELDRILEIYAYARKFMAENGNATQWKDSYPPVELIKQDIGEGKCHVCVEGDKILGVFYFAGEDDPAYREIRDGHWLNEEPYAVVHRIASAEGTKGVASFCLNWALEQTGNIRIDTHEDNKPMQGLLKKRDFQYCGRITLADGSPRIAFQKVGTSSDS